MRNVFLYFRLNWTSWRTKNLLFRSLTNLAYMQPALLAGNDCCHICSITISTQHCQLEVFLRPLALLAHVTDVIPHIFDIIYGCLLPILPNLDFLHRLIDFFRLLTFIGFLKLFFISFCLLLCVLLSVHSSLVWYHITLVIGFFLLDEWNGCGEPSEKPDLWSYNSRANVS